jgi:uncharacterized membrane protein YfcA
MDFRVPILGFVVGVLVGLTGMGGGAVMTPALILLGFAKPVIAVGTDLLCATLTKAAGVFVHWRQKTIDFTIVKRLAFGSIPGALAGLALLAYLRSRGGDTMDRIVVRMLGIALVCVALSLLVRSLGGSRLKPSCDLPNLKGPAWLTSLVGALIGFLVSITSVGSGSLIIACLVLLYPSTPLRRIVGSDILHALFLVGVSAFGHLGLGSINAPLLGGLLVGSLPGVWLGSRMSAFFPEKVLQPILATTLLFFGFKLL